MTIEIQYDDRFSEQVAEKHDSNPLAGMKIRVGDEYVLGGPSTAASDYVTENLTAQLHAAPAIVADQTQVIEFHGGPVWLVLEPRDEQSIALTGCHTYAGVENPDKRLSTDTTRAVTKRAWLSELVRATRAYHEQLTGLHPSLAGSEDVQALREALQTAERTLDEL
ncbi:hypothetical protein ACFQH6_18705 [Halobacteriaceae archaeon GCM10025711]